MLVSTTEKCPYCLSINTKDNACLNCNACKVAHDELTDIEIKTGWTHCDVEIIDPQPVVKRIRDGWDISGIPCFMGIPEYHINTDERFGRKGRAFKRIDEVWVWRLK